MLLFTFSNFGCKCTIYIFDRLFDPTYLNIDPNDEEGWQVYAEKVRDIMSKCLGAGKVDMGYRSSLEFQEEYKKSCARIIARRNGKAVHQD